MKIDTFDAAIGRWREILPALGVATAVLNGQHQPCPMCGGTDRFRFTDRNRKGDFYCSQCGAGMGMKLLMEINGWDYKRAASEVDRIIGNLPPTSPEFIPNKSNPTALRNVYAGSETLNGGVNCAGRYLVRRGLKGPWPKALRWTTLRHKPMGIVTYGMIAVFSDEHGKPATIHRTFLNEDGTKANVEPVRMFMPGNVPAGGAIRLGEAAETMGIAEGIETALSASLMYGMPVWATTSSVMLEKWQPPEIAKHITIFADNDANFTGQAAAYALAKRLTMEAEKNKIKGSVAVETPSVVSFDWNDVLMERSKVG
jgi:putative DNA primase/helicase